MFSPKFLLGLVLSFFIYFASTVIFCSAEFHALCDENAIFTKLRKVFTFSTNLQPHQKQLLASWPLHFSHVYTFKVNSIFTAAIMNAFVRNCQFPFSSIKIICWFNPFGPSHFLSLLWVQVSGNSSSLTANKNRVKSQLALLHFDGLFCWAIFLVSFRNVFRFCFQISLIWIRWWNTCAFEPSFRQSSSLQVYA